MKAAIRCSGMLFIVIVAGCGGNGYAEHEAVMKDVIKELENIATAMESVKDPATAKAAAPKIEQASENLTKIGEKIDTLPKITKADDEKLQKAYEPQLEKVGKRLEKAAGQAGFNSQGDATFMKALKKMETMGKVLEKIAAKHQ